VDHYDTALRELINKKKHGGKIEKPKKRKPAEVINLMDALRRSVTANRGEARSPPRRADTHRQRTPANRSNARAREAS
jgi:DNA end-binding protein Ku